MDKLTYKKINDNVITIDLHNGYTVMAISKWEPKIKGYITTLYLKDNTIDTFQLILGAENIKFHANYKTINSAILKQVGTYLEEGFFDSYINTYEFEQNCIHSGYVELENKRYNQEIFDHAS